MTDSAIHRKLASVLSRHVLVLDGRVAALHEEGVRAIKRCLQPRKAFANVRVLSCKRNDGSFSPEVLQVLADDAGVPIEFPPAFWNAVASSALAENMSERDGSQRDSDPIVEVEAEVERRDSLVELLGSWGTL